MSFNSATVSRTETKPGSSFLESKEDIEGSGELLGRTVAPEDSDHDRPLPSPPTGDSSSSSPLQKVTDFFISSSHPIKMEKYTLIIDQYVKALGGPAGVKMTFLQLKGCNQKNRLVRHLTEAYRILAGQGNYKNDRKRYQAFVKEFRATIETKQYQETHKLSESKTGFKLAHCIRATKNLVGARWFQSEMYGYLKESTDLYIGYTDDSSQSSESESSSGSFSERFESMTKKVKDAPLEVKKSPATLGVQKLQGAVGLKDFSGTENVPFIRCRYRYRNEVTGRERVIEYMRHSRPTVGGNVFEFVGGVASRAIKSLSGSEGPSMHDGETIASDYEEAIQVAAERGEAIFYIVHQRRIAGGIENEADSTMLIERIDGNHPNFHTLIQSVEGSPI